MANTPESQAKARTNHWILSMSGIGDIGSNFIAVVGIEGWLEWVDEEEIGKVNLDSCVKKYYCEVEWSGKPKDRSMILCTVSVKLGKVMQT